MALNQPFSKIKEQTPSFVESTSKRIRCLLNKITPVTYDELIQEFLEIIRVYSDETTTEIFADIMFTMAISDSRYCVMYADLCKASCELDEDFRKIIVRKCQKSFEYGIEFARKILENQGSKCADDENEEWMKQKLRMRGTIRFFGELYRHNIITYSTIQCCLTHLMKEYEESKNEIFIEYTSRLIESVGLNHEKHLISNPNGEETISNYLNKMIDQLFLQKEGFSKRIRFMIMNLIELRKSGWVDRRVLASVILPRAYREVKMKKR